jgi:hypothetical protein
MARSVNVWTTNWRATGTNVQVPQYEQTIRIEWVDDAGEARKAQRTVRFPNVLANIPARRPKEYVEAMLMREARILAGIDEDA